MHQKNILSSGRPLKSAKKVLILFHGRGGSATDILSLSSHLKVENFAMLAPQATDYTWYPHSFLVPVKENEPWLSSAMRLINEMVDDLLKMDFSHKDIFFLGFSQGACLALEYTARHPKRYGGIIAFTGGLIGDRINKEMYSGDFKKTPVFIGSGNPDAHVPPERVEESAEIFKELNASVTSVIYVNIGHTITSEEIDHANKLLSKG